MKSYHLRTIILNIQDHLSGDVLPQRISDDPLLSGTLNLKTVIVQNHPTASNSKHLLKLSTMTTQCLLLFALLLIMVLAAVTGVCIVKISELNKIVETQDVTIFAQQIQMLTNQLNYTKQRQGILNKIIYSNSYCLRTTTYFVHWRFFDLSIMKQSLPDFLEDSIRRIYTIILYDNNHLSGIPKVFANL